MAVADTSQVIQHLRRIVHPPDDGLRDGQLLERYLTDHEQDAFAALVRRHGRMVLGVCRRILKEPADADDAFQATFLVLVRKAGGFLSRPTIGDWLYGVAYHTALKARAAARRRRERETQAAQMTAQEPSLKDTGREVLELLDRELQHLPEKYRAPVILCDLEERTHQEAARLLGCPPGTVSGRLSRARVLLARRLRRHGLALSAGALAALLSESTASARVPSVLIESTIQAATAGTISAPVAALTEGVLHAMMLNKIKMVTVVLLTLGFLGTGAGVLTHRALADKPSAAADQEKPKAAVKEKPGAPNKEEAGDVTGFVQSVDAEKHTLTLSGGKQAAAKTFDVSKDAKVLLQNGKADTKEGKLADLKEGVSVTLKLSADKKTIVSITASGPSVRGTVKAVDAAKRKLTVTLGGKKPEAAPDQTFEVAADASIVILDSKTKDKQAPRERTLADVPVGSIVSLKLSVDQKIIGSIQAEGPEFSGTVKAVDADKNTLTVSSKAGGDRTFNVPADVPITFGGSKDKKEAPVERKLTDVPVGAQVSIQLSPDQQSVLSVRAEGSNIDGTVKAVDAGKGQLTIAVAVNKGEVGVDRTVTVAADTDLRIDGKSGKLGDVPLGAQVSVRLRPDQKAALSVSAEGSSVPGTVKALDADKRRITVVAGGGKKGDSGEDRTFDIAADVVVRIDGKEAKLAAVPVGSVVRLKLAVDQKKVKEIEATGRMLQGSVKSVDAANGGITLADDAGEHTLTFAKEAPLVVDGKPVKPGEVPVEAIVIARLAADQHTVLSLTAEGPTYKGIVKGVNGNNTITVSVQVSKTDFEEKTFEVSKNVQVLTGINGVAVTLADVKVDKEVVLRLSAGRKGVLRVTLVGE